MILGKEKVVAKVLICDDSVFALQRHKKLFESEGHEVTAVQAGKDVYLFLEQGRPFDLIILDLLMPEEGGVNVLKKIKEKYPQYNIVIVSADIQAKRKQEVIQAGAIDLINKPLNEEKVKLIMEKLNAVI